MAFSPDSLPMSVQEVYNKGAFYWPQVVVECAKHKILDVDRLASIVFYLHYPARNGAPIAASETAMIEKWKAFRTLIKAMVPVLSKPKPEAPVDEATQEWKKYTWGRFKFGRFLTQPGRDWIEVPPVGVEAIRAAGTDPDWGHLVLWKSQEHSGCPQCNLQDMRLQWFREFPTSISYYRRKTGETDERFLKILSMTFDSWNTSVAFYVLKKKWCVKKAEARARQDGVELMQATVGGFMAVLGLTGSGSLFARHSAPVPLTELRSKLLDPAFVGRVDTMYRNNLEKKSQLLNP